MHSPINTRHDHQPQFSHLTKKGMGTSAMMSSINSHIGVLFCCSCKCKEMFLKKQRENPYL